MILLFLPLTAAKDPLLSLLSALKGGSLKRPFSIWLLRSMALPPTLPKNSSSFSGKKWPFLHSQESEEGSRAEKEGSSGRRNGFIWLSEKRLKGKTPRQISEDHLIPYERTPSRLASRDVPFADKRSFAVGSS